MLWFRGFPGGDVGMAGVLALLAVSALRAFSFGCDLAADFARTRPEGWAPALPGT
jgi:hypothetical protein